MTDCPQGGGEVLAEIRRVVDDGRLSPEAVGLLSTTLQAVLIGDAPPWRHNVATVDFTVDGDVPSKSNCYVPTIIRKRGRKAHASMAKKPELTTYEKKFALQCPAKFKDMKIGYFGAVLFVTYSTERPDLDNASKIIFDCLQKCGVIENDRKLRHYHPYRRHDPSRPQIRILLIPYQENLFAT